MTECTQCDGTGGVIKCTICPNIETCTHNKKNLVVVCEACDGTGNSPHDHDNATYIIGTMQRRHAELIDPDAGLLLNSEDYFIHLLGDFAGDSMVEIELVQHRGQCIEPHVLGYAIAFVAGFQAGLEIE